MKEKQLERKYLKLFKGILKQIILSGHSVIVCTDGAAALTLLNGLSGWRTMSVNNALHVVFNHRQFLVAKDIDEELYKIL